MTVKEIILEYLKANGFVGLISNNCGCGIDDLMPCWECNGECVPAKYFCKSAGCGSDSDECYCNVSPDTCDQSGEYEE